MDAYVGEIRIFAGPYAPQGWAFCWGQTLSIAQYDALFALIGTKYGGDGQTSFNLPDLRGRVPVHQGQGGGLTRRVVGETFGSERETLNAGHLPAHSHSLLANADGTTVTNLPTDNLLAPSSFSLYTSDQSQTGVLKAGTVSVSGSATPASHENVMPSLCINYIIALEGFFPDRP